MVSTPTALTLGEGSLNLGCSLESQNHGRRCSLGHWDAESLPSGPLGFALDLPVSY